MNNNIDDNSLPMKALGEIPTPKKDAKEITGLVKESGKITGYQLSDNRIVDKEEGIRMAREGEIKDVGVATNRGTEYLKSIPDGSESNNLGNLPTVK